MKCIECGEEMRIDCKDKNFKGNYDLYWVCDNCQTGCIEEIRFSQRYREIWHSEKNGKVKDYEKKYRINRNKY